MTFELGAASFFAFLLALARAAAWLSFAPPFSASALPALVKFGFAAALALTVSPQFAATVGSGSLSTASFITDLVAQVATGAGLGYVTSLLLSAVASAGALVDVSSGLSAAQSFDPFSGNVSAVTSNTYSLLMTTLLFATQGYLLIVKGFLTSFQAVGLAAGPASLLGAALASEMGFFFLAAIEMAAPVIAAMFLAYVALGLLTRAAPQLNVMALGFGTNIALAFVVVTACLALLPGAVSTLVDRAVRDSLGFLGITP
ncbi:MAG: flagellar biosynthetic protein FliR [Acidimicrobiales bacterium]